MFWRKQRKPKVSKKTLKSAKALKEMGFHIPIETPKKKYPPVLRPFVWTERRLEHVLAWLRRLALLEILAIISNVGILFAIVTYAATEKQRRDEVVFTAWQTITNAEGQSGSGGRIQALEFLNASPGANWRRRAICLWLCPWEPESLIGVNLSGSNEKDIVILRGVILTNADLQGANFSAALLAEADLTNAYLREADLTNAFLGRADLTNAFLGGADLTGANLWNANLTNTFLQADLTNASLFGANLTNAFLQKADLTNADLRGADLTNADLRGADLTNADLREADLTHANFRETNLTNADLREADLTHANLKEADLTHANLLGADLTNVSLCRTILPEHIGLDPNRDCPE